MQPPQRKLLKQHSDPLHSARSTQSSCPSPQKPRPVSLGTTPTWQLAATPRSSDWFLRTPLPTIIGSPTKVGPPPFLTQKLLWNVIPPRRNSHHTASSYRGCWDRLMRQVFYPDVVQTAAPFKVPQTPPSQSFCPQYVNMHGARSRQPDPRATRSHFGR